jgi:hypothetical protein
MRVACLFSVVRSQLLASSLVLDCWLGGWGV